MIEFVVHYVSGGDHAETPLARDHQAREATAQRVLVVGEMLTGPLGAVELVLDVAFSHDGTAHVFVTPTMPSAHVAQGLKTRDFGAPSLVPFEGETVADLLAFFARFPNDYPHLRSAGARC